MHLFLLVLVCSGCAWIFSCFSFFWPSRFLLCLLLVFFFFLVVHYCLMLPAKPCLRSLFCFPWGRVLSHCVLFSFASAFLRFFLFCVLSSFLFLFYCFCCPLVLLSSCSGCALLFLLVLSLLSFLLLCTGCPVFAPPSFLRSFSPLPCSVASPVYLGSDALLPDSRCSSLFLLFRVPSLSLLPCCAALSEPR